MNRWRIAAAVAGLVGAFVATPVQAADWCIHDPQVIIQLPGDHSMVVYVTEGVLGANHQAALASAEIGYTARRSRGGTVMVTIYDLIPRDRYGRFPTEMTVSSQPYGSGLVYGTVFGTSGIPMVLSFKTQQWAP